MEMDEAPARLRCKPSWLLNKVSARAHRLIKETMAAAGGLTSAQIATALGVPAGTVRYRLSLARRTLGAALAAYDQAAGTAEER